MITAPTRSSASSNFSIAIPVLCNLELDPVAHEECQPTNWSLDYHHLHHKQRTCASVKQQEGVTFYSTRKGDQRRPKNVGHSPGEGTPVPRGETKSRHKLHKSNVTRQRPGNSFCRVTFTSAEASTALSSG